MGNGFADGIAAGATAGAGHIGAHLHILYGPPPARALLYEGAAVVAEAGGQWLLLVLRHWLLLVLRHWLLLVLRHWLLLGATSIPRLFGGSRLSES